MTIAESAQAAEKPAPSTTRAPRYLRRPEVEFRTGCKKSLIYRLQKKGLFPHNVKLQGSRTVVWLESDIDAYIERAKAVTA